MKDRVWLVTGCSTGLGRSIVQEVLSRGERVVATARDPRTLDELVASAPNRAIAVALDVTKPSQIKMVIDRAMSDFGRIDVVVNNAGFGFKGAIEEATDADVRRVFDTNFFGVLTLLRMVLPYLRKQRSGHIVNISSIGGFRGRAGSGIYASTKFALVGLSEALAGEMADFGVKVTVVAPGAMRTDYAGRSLGRAQPMKAYDFSPTAQRWRVPAKEKQSGDPRRMARAILEAVNAPDPPLWLVLGPAALTEARSKLRTVEKSLDTWQALSGSVDYDPADTEAPAKISLKISD